MEENHRWTLRKLQEPPANRARISIKPLSLMLSAVLLLVAAVFAAPALAAVTSGLYRISSNYLVRHVISHSGGEIAAWVDRGTLEQLWSVIISNGSASIQNVGTGAFISIVEDGPGASVVPGATPYLWKITPDSRSAIRTVSGDKELSLWDSYEGQLLADHPNDSNAHRWTFVPAVPQPHAYRVWNEANNLYLDEVPGDCSSDVSSCIAATPFNSSCKSQVWHVDGTSSCGGLPTLQNAASGKYLCESPLGFSGTQPSAGPVAVEWVYGFVGGQMTLLSTFLDLFDVTTLTVSGGKVYLSASETGPGTSSFRDQTWIFKPVF